MTVTNESFTLLRHADRFFIGGEWVVPSSDATIDVIDSGTEEHFFSVAEAQEADMSRAVASARAAFDDGPWPTAPTPTIQAFTPRSISRRRSVCWALCSSARVRPAKPLPHDPPAPITYANGSDGRRSERVWTQTLFLAASEPFWTNGARRTHLETPCFFLSIPTRSALPR